MHVPDFDTLVPAPDTIVIFLKGLFFASASDRGNESVKIWHVNGRFVAETSATLLAFPVKYMFHLQRRISLYFAEQFFLKFLFLGGEQLITDPVLVVSSGWQPHIP